MKRRDSSIMNKEELNFFFNQTPAHQKLLKTFFKNSVVKVGTSEGQKVEKNHIILGTRLGPDSNCIEGLVHEMGHLLEIDNRRMLRPGWGFKFGKAIQILGQIYHEPQTYQASLRECRVMAIEMMIYDLIGHPYEPASIIQALSYMNDFLMVPGKTDKARLNYLLKSCLKHKTTLKPEEILILWKERNVYLKKKLHA